MTSRSTPRSAPVIPRRAQVASRSTTVTPGGANAPPRSAKAIRQYLQRHSLHDSTLVDARNRVDHCVVVPVRGESASFVDALLRAVPEGRRLLAILVVNASTSSGDRVLGRNRELLERLATRQSELERGGLDLTVIDHTSRAELRFSDDDGVGLARRIGLDLALARWAAGFVAQPWLHTTDADAELDPRVFSCTQDHADAAALTFPFWHVASADAELDRATATYELWLRYYVLGLQYAGSPYAHHALGSAIAVHAWAYAAVRGMPTRLAGEDFHLLDKVAKLGPVVRANVPPIRLRSRRSTRTPFGTGASVERMLQSPHATLEFYDPRVFIALAACLRRVRDAVHAGEHRIVDAMLAPCIRSSSGRPREDPGDSLSALPELGHVVARALRDVGGDALARVCGSTFSPAQNLRRFDTWFDGLRTLRFVRALRRDVWQDVPWQRAIEAAPFFAPSLVALDDHKGLDGLDARATSGCIAPALEDARKHAFLLERPARVTGLVSDGYLAKMR